MGLKGTIELAINNIFFYLDDITLCILKMIFGRFEKIHR